MPIKDLNEAIDQIKEEQGITSDEKFGTYLRQLDKTDSISPEERKAYIGIYRLLYNVEKTDGAALGAVIKADREITLSSLLSAVRTGKKGSMDAIINDDFGTLEGLNKSSETITDQIASAFASGEEPGNTDKKSNQDAFNGQTEYFNRMLKLMKEKISPDKLNDLKQCINQQAEMQEQANPEFAPELSGRKGIWETLKDVPVEKLFDQLKDTADVLPEDEVYASKVQELRELYKNSDQAVRFLNDYKIPGTAVNILMANHILSNGETPFKKLLRQQSENIVENSENSLKETDEFTDTLIDKDSMNEVYKNLEDSAKDALDKACSEETIDSKTLAQLKNIGMQMSFLRTLADREFYRIPVETDGVVTNMNLTILRGTGASGKLAATVWSKRLGTVKAELSLKEQSLKGFISCDNRSGLELIQKNAGVIEQTAKENGLEVKQLDFGLVLKGNESAGYQGMESGTNETNLKPDNERILYRMAKALVSTVRSAEHAGAEADRIAS
jgi:hypothetical protein